MAENIIFFIGGILFGGMLIYGILKTTIKALEKEMTAHVVTKEQLMTDAKETHTQINSLSVQKQELQTRWELSLEENDQLKREMLKLKELNENSMREKIELKSENSSLLEKLSFQKNEMDRLHKQTVLHFENVAQKLFEEKADKFTQVNKQNMNAILQPLNENIDRFKKQVEETYDKESKMRFSLDERIKELMNQTIKMSAEATNLANALKTNHKKQGDWGEMILESILQKSGLVKDREYRVQNTLVTEEGKNVRPDIIVDLPNNRSIVIDSKVSLNAYDAYCTSEIKEEQQLFLINHLKAVRSHIDDLSSKNYNQLVNSLDFTMLFIPIEPAYLLAMQQDPNLWNEAYQKRVLLISPTNLIACLKLIVDLWNRDKQDKSAQKIVKQAEKMYEKMVLFTKSFDQVGKQLQQAQESYFKAQNQWKEGRGNVISQTNQLLKYGISPKKSLNNGAIDHFEEQEEQEV